MKEYTCNECGRVHMGITMEHAKREIETFYLMCEELTITEKERYYGEYDVSLDNFTRCFNCGNDYKNFRPSIDSDCEAGVTLTPIVIDD